MSVHIMGLVWDCDLERDEKYVLLAYADHADHTGRSIYPGDPLVAWKTGYSEKQVMRIRLKLIEKGFLLRDGPSPFRTQAYRIDLDALPKRNPYQAQRRGRPAYRPQTAESEPETPSKDEKSGDIVSPDYQETEDTTSPILEKEGTFCPPITDISEKQGTFPQKIGDIAMSVNPSITVINKSSNLIDGVLQKRIAGSQFTPTQAWNAVVGQLQMEMPKAPFESYVRRCEVCDFREGTFYILTGNVYAREWLNSRLTSSATRLLVGICNQHVEIKFVAQEDLLRANMSQEQECATL